MSEIIRDRGEGVVGLRLNRPDKKNALTQAMYADLTESLLAADSDEGVRAVVISAEGPDFCAGNDIFDFARDFPVSQGMPVEDLPVFRFLRALTFFSKPLICAVQGQAVGVGVTLLLHCDLVVAADDVRLSLPFLKLGLVPEAGSTLLLPQRIGHARAFAWLALGEVVGAEGARELGLVNRVVPGEMLDAAANDMAATVSRWSPAALKHTKALMRDPEALWQVVLAEGEIFRRMLTSPEAMAAFSAFMRK